MSDTCTCPSQLTEVDVDFLLRWVSDVGEKDLSEDISSGELQMEMYWMGVFLYSKFHGLSPAPVKWNRPGLRDERRVYHKVLKKYMLPEEVKIANRRILKHVKKKLASIEA